MDTTTNQLKYKFVAIYNDGTIFTQPDNDISLVNPTKSSFYDIDHSKLIAFALVKEESENSNHKEFLVDLRDGHFEINGVSLNDVKFNKDDEIYCFNESVETSSLNRRLIYFRNNKIIFNSFSGDSHNVTYSLGWQATENGKNIKKIIEIL